MRGSEENSSGMVTLPVSSSLNAMIQDDSMSDDVFEVETENRVSRLTPGDQLPVTSSTPSPTGYRDYKPPAELLNNGYHSSITRNNNRISPRREFARDEGEIHKTILLGDSGVGKTSLLVQFDTGKFEGNFAATVGIGFTVMLLGDSGVGKTCILTRFRDGRFLPGNHISTVGIDFRNKIVTVADTKVKLQIWDTAGQERFRSVTHAYYRDAHALLLLYDVTNKTSYDNIRAWLGEIREYAQTEVIMLLGNKCDCGTERVIRKEDGKRLADEYDVPFMETSAKTGVNVELAFLAIAKELLARKAAIPDTERFNVHDYVREESQKSTCFTSNCQTT